MNPYEEFVAAHSRLVREAKSLPLGGFESPLRKSLPPNAQKVLFFAPHPDDETILGGLALRLLREARMRVIDVAVTQGSRKERQAERFSELQKACDYIGFGLVATAPNGMEGINPKTRQQNTAHWAECINVITDILRSHQPRVIFFPHEHDWNSTHIGTHFLVMDALRQMPSNFSCFLVETEIWGQMARPNLMVEISATDLSDMITATTFHVGEVKRNPYHLLMPAWMMDNVRRGAELVGGQGGAAPDFTFAVLNRLRKWEKSRIVEVLAGGKIVPASMNVGELFE
jgi:LmbE family N-acetylglucosaminyl deacetylase